MNYVFMFKNQKNFRGDDHTDLKMLKTSIKQWYKLFKDDNKKMYICGSYNQDEVSEIALYLTENFINKYDIKIINVGQIPEDFNKNKTSRINYQMIFAYNFIKEPIILCTNDIFPIKLIDKNYLNKEYIIKYKDCTQITEPHWWEQEYIDAIDYFNITFKTDFKTMYKGHSIYYIDKDFINFLNENPFLMHNIPRNVSLILWLQMNGETVYKPGFGLATFYKNKWLIDKKILQKIKILDVTKPNDLKTKKLLSKIIKK